MATLTYGPRLGGPSPTGFKAWVMTDSAATVALQTRVAGASTWVTSDTQAIDTTRRNTTILTATGLQATTKYEYRLLIDGTPTGVTYTTITMPPQNGGTFVLYHLSDFHELALATTEVNSWNLSDWSTNCYTPGIPAVLLCAGDLIEPHAAQTSDERIDLALTQIDSLTGTSGIWSHIPVLYMWDDWDFSGNNGNREQFLYCTPADITVPTRYWDVLWRDHERPAAPSWGYHKEIAGVPILIPDSRSQKAPTGTGSGVRILFGNEPLNNSSTCYGTNQHAWLKSLVATYSERALVLFVSTHTFQDNINTSTNAGVLSGSRDSLGIFHKAARNDLFLPVSSLYVSRKNLAVLGGDDHHNAVYSGLNLSKPVRYDGTDNSVHPGMDYELNYIRFIVSSGGSGSVTNTTFGTGNFGAAAANTCVCKWTITSAAAGQLVSARVTYYQCAAAEVGQIPTSSEGQATGKPLDYYFENGLWQIYNATTGAQNQHYPPENTQSQSWERAYLDDRTGLLVSERYAVRDLDGELRDKRDMGDLDADWARRSHKHRQERGSIDP